MKHCTHFIFSFLILISASAFSQSECKVLLPELSGSYTGKCKNGLANGKGEAIGKDSYVGKFKNGLPHGKGKYTWSTGEHFDGVWKKGKRHGVGTYVIKTTKKDSILHGIWKDDKFVEIIIPDSYEITYKNNISSYSVKKISEGNKVEFKITQRGTTANIRDLYVNSSSGTTYYNGSVFGVEHFQLPVKVKLTYKIPSAMDQSETNIDFEIEFIDNGNFLVSLKH